MSPGLIGFATGGGSGRMHDRTLELSADEMRRLVDLAMDRIVAHIESLPAQPAGVGQGGVELARSLVEQMPEQGVPFEQLLGQLFERVIPHSFNTAGPGYLAYIPGGGIFHSAVADLISNAVNRYVGVWLAAPGLAQLETNVVRWFAEIIGYPEGSAGVLTTGGSLANLIAVITARMNRLPEDFLSGILYASDQVHHSVAKAAGLAGFPSRNIRTIPSDDRFRIRADLLAAQVEQDRKSSLTPFMVVASAGTTNTGAIDDLEALADLAKREGLWLHVDAAYGGFFMLTERGRAGMRGIDRADSIVVDPHKGLFLPYGNGALLVREAATLRASHRADADYMPQVPDDCGALNFSDLSPELSRDFRGLRVWLPIKMHGIAPFRRYLDEKLDLAALAWQELRSIPGIEIVAEPQLSVVAFRYQRQGSSAETLNRLNRELLARILRRGRVWMSGTMLGNRFVLRICVLSFRTHADRVEEGLEIIRQSVAGIGVA